ncbi:PBSX family phage terminase large subunit [Faecalispora jeddahensis]|uniref:PBSX family phage terminase large subunit n=1 Tax=Faecalispora jeddahensis TaxID=1414721 RepID=UPI0018988FDA|nr:PBSX family phage terminase large subunit [Faecalispora jeddahensis]
MEFHPFSKKQLQALSWWCRGSPFEHYSAVICDGAVRSGKTLCLGISFIAWAFYRFDGQSFALCGKTIRSLRRNLVVPLLPVLRENGFECSLKLSENLLTISVGGRENRFYLFGGKDESSSALIQGMTLAGVLFDEVALMPRSFVEQALARCSVEGSTFWFNCNPEHPQHWFYREWIQNAAKKNALYLHFQMEDNPSLSEAMLERYRGLYSGAFYRRFVLGEWVAAEGLVYPFMTQEQFCPVPRGALERYVISCDYGTVNPSSFGLWGRKNGCWYRIAEYYYDSRREGFQRTDEEHYAGLCQLAGGRKIECVVADPSAASFMAVIRRHGEFRVIPARNDVLDGIRQVAAALKAGQLCICDTCADAMREFALYRWSSDSTRDAPIKENDHAMDDIRYFTATILQQDAEGCFAVAAPRRTGEYDGLV